MFILISGIAIKTLAFVPLRMPLLFDATARYALSCGINSVREKKRKRKIREKALIFSQTIQAIDILLLSIKEYEGGRISICLLM